MCRHLTIPDSPFPILPTSDNLTLVARPFRYQVKVFAFDSLAVSMPYNHRHRDCQFSPHPHHPSTTDIPTATCSTHVRQKPRPYLEQSMPVLLCYSIVLLSVY
jgi:hypothetical protein